MKLIGLANSNTLKLVNYTISLFENKHSEIIDLSEFKNVTNPVISKFEDVKFLIIVLENCANLNAIDDFRTTNKNVFKNTSILLLSTTDHLDILATAKNQFTTYGATILDTFYLPSYLTNFNPTEGITNIKLSLELIRKVNIIKQNNFNNYFKKRISTCGIDTTGFENCDASSY